MQQTVDAVVVTKDLTVVETDVDLETTLASGLFYFSSAVADSDVEVDVADVEMTAAYGSSSYCSAVVDSALDPAMDADATTVATKIKWGLS